MSKAQKHTKKRHEKTPEPIVLFKDIQTHILEGTGEEEYRDFLGQILASDDKEILLLRNRARRAELKLARRHKLPLVHVALALHRFPKKVRKRLRRLKRKIYRRIKKFSRKPASAPSQIKGTVSVIIATWTEVPTLEKSINSVREQKGLPQDRIEIILSVNGGDREYYSRLEKRYGSIPNLKIIFTDRKGLGVARNLGAASANGEYITFLDDDDWLTEGYLAEMLSLAGKETGIIMGKLYDADDDRFIQDTYINKGIAKQSEPRTTDYLSASSIFGNLTSKLIRRSLFTDDFLEIPEDMDHSEDILFWALNFGRIHGELAFMNPKSPEGYVRFLTEKSMSRPSADLLRLYISDKRALIKELSHMVLSETTEAAHKEFICRQIRAQENHVLNYCAELNDPLLIADIQTELKRDPALLMKRSKFATHKGVAFCQLFPAEADPSAYVASRRLRQIGELEDELIDWQVFKQNYRVRRHQDPLYDAVFANLYYGQKASVSTIGVFCNLGDQSYLRWGKRAFERAIPYRADVIYSRSMTPASHIAAYLYKKANPEAKWYAEFSDPLAKNTVGQKRRIDDDLFEDIEYAVYSSADKIIFTNNNQMEYMLSYNPRPELNASIRERALVLSHPAIPREYVGIMPESYSMDPEMINIGYFGSFYLNRSHHAMLSLLKNPNVALHVFTPDYFHSEYDSITEDVRENNLDGSRLHTNESVPLLTMLTIASKMDYLFLSDTGFPGSINPFLPSKLSDYLASGTKVIAVTQQGSPLSSIINEQILHVDKLSDTFVLSLAKQKTQ
ncbi:MAG: glycosyltransferase [Actinomycetes bacterium]|nr:glycosyltransferase [Actinomycetes bacterium]